MYGHIFKIEITLAILSLDGKIPVANIWFVISVNEFITAGLTNFNNREEISSYPPVHQYIQNEGNSCTAHSDST